MTMPTVKFNNGIVFPAFGLGTWQSKPGEVEQAVKEAINAGYRHIDGAHVYQNEMEVGSAIKEVMQQGVVKREDLFITSKLWCTYHRPDMVEGAIRTTLKHLGLDYLDLYLIHWPEAYKEGDDLFPRKDGKLIYSDVDYLDTWKAMEELVEKGLTKSIGVSNFNKRQLDRLMEVAKIKPVTNQIEVHPYLSQEKLASHCRSLGIVVTAYSPLGSPGTARDNPEEVPLLENTKLKEIADKYNKNVAQILIRYAIDRGMIVIPKSVTKSRIIENIDVFNFKLTDDDIQQICELNKDGRFCVMDDKDHQYHPFNDEY